jgi:hypothetical protein
MKIYSIKIWKWDKTLLDTTCQFRTPEEALAYSMGAFEGLRIAGEEPTGIEVKPKK